MAFRVNLEQRGLQSQLDVLAWCNCLSIVLLIAKCTGKWFCSFLLSWQLRKQGPRPASLLHGPPEQNLQCQIVPFTSDLFCSRATAAINLLYTVRVLCRLKLKQVKR